MNPPEGSDKDLKNLMILILSVVIIFVCLRFVPGQKTTPVTQEVWTGDHVVLRTKAAVPDEVIESARQVIEMRLGQLDLRNVRSELEKDAVSGESSIALDFSYAGANRSEIEHVLLSPNTFEGRVDGTVVFTEVKKVFSDAQHSGVRQTSDDLFRFWFTVELNQQGARRFAEITKACPRDSTGEMLVERCNLKLTLDGAVISDLRIASSLAGKAVTEARIEGSGPTRDEALSEMRQLQNALSTGTLPTLLYIEEWVSVTEMI